MQISRRRFFYMGVSLLLIAIGLITIFSVGLNLGIDFSGGSIITLNMGGEFETSEIERILQDKNMFDAPVQRSGGSAEFFAIVRLKLQGDDAAEISRRETLVQEIQAIYPNTSLESVDMVGSSAIMNLIRSALVALGIAGVLILIYITFRFEFFSGISAVLCLIHDVAIMISFVAITQMEVNSNLIAGVLTIIGYSINDTIVVFDRVRENRAIFAQYGMDQLVDKSIKETFSRSVYTSLTTLVTIGALYVLGAESIRNFALPIIVGLLAGTYSSLVIAGPLWSLLLEKRKRIG